MYKRQIEYCAELGAEPYFCLNMGSGSLEEALAWVEYCNDNRGTYWADRRRQGGHGAPYGVPWWGLGNEIYGPWQVGALSAEEYVAEATRWARAIRMIDPGAKLVSCGEDVYKRQPWASASNSRRALPASRSAAATAAPGSSGLSVPWPRPRLTTWPPMAATSSA